MPNVRSQPGRVWRVTLDRPESRNAVTVEMLGAVTAALRDAATDPAARAVVIDGAGDDFCAGADLGELEAAAGGPDGVVSPGPLEEMLDAVAGHPLPVIVAARGAALGAGCQLVVAADLAVVAEDARLGIPSGRLGVVVGFPNVRRLVQLVGPRRAAELLLAGRIASGVEAAAWGLAGRAVPTGDVASHALELAEAVADAAPLSVRASKRGIRLAADGEDPGEFEMLAAAAFASDDLKEGLRAFRERRPPRFGGS